MFGKLRRLFRLLFRRLRFQPSSFRPFLNRIPTSLFLDNPFFYSFFLKSNLPALDSGEVAFYRILSFFILILGHTAIRSDELPSSLPAILTALRTKHRSENAHTGTSGKIPSAPLNPSSHSTSRRTSADSARRPLHRQRLPSYDPKGKSSPAKA